MKTQTILAAACVAGGLLAAGPASAASRIGTLECDISGGVGMIIGSNKSARCSYVDRAGRREVYFGNVSRLGLDVGVTQRARMVWTVVAETRRLGRGALAGNYAGAAADASLGVGGGAKILVGGSNNTITLQPLSVQAQRGVNVAVGVESLTLTPAMRARR
ncbi:MAG: hypothetical protein BGP06_03000 [Rhizobiales bacterium 65-9]|nr:DUF992 domain-containing protein [Hyphomicrobiales bacterium]OJY35828.1 MAG: hypothetical protein BGP06_03000 [Rhizobiales bacterium 65-9]